MEINITNVPTFDRNMESAQMYRKTSNNDYRNFIEFFHATFIPYIKNITDSHPEYTAQDLENHIKLDITELSEKVFSAANVYRFYLETYAHQFLVDNPDKFQEIYDDVTSERYDSFQKIENSQYANTFRGLCMTYMLELLPTYELDIEDYIANLPEGYYSTILSEKRNGTPENKIWNDLLKRYKSEYNYTFKNLKDFTTSARTVIFGFPEYLKSDKPELEKFIRERLEASIIDLSAQFDKLGFTKRAQEIRKSNLSRIGLDELSQKLDDNMFLQNQLSGALSSLNMADLIAYNTYLVNRFSKEANSLQESFFALYQYGMIEKFLDPEVQKFLNLKDAINSHTETDPAEKYNTDKNSSYPTKDDLFTMLKLLYPKKAYSSIITRIAPLPVARKDSSKVSVPGLIHEIKKVYPTREDFDKAISAIEDFYPTPAEVNIVLDKIAFMHTPTKLFLYDVQSQVDSDHGDFVTELSKEEEKETFGNISDNDDIIRYSYRPYQNFMQNMYGEQYKEYFDKSFRKLPKYEFVPESELPKSDLDADSKKFLRFYTPIFYSYSFKNDFIDSIIALICSGKDMQNAGIIPDSISADGTTAKIDRITGIGLDPALTSAVQVHTSKKSIIEFLDEFTHSSMMPVYEGMEDFEGVSIQAVAPFSKNLSKYLKTLVKSPDLSPQAQKYVSRIYSLSTRKVPDHLCEDAYSSTGRKKKKPIFNRRYVDLRTGRLYRFEKGNYIPIEPKIVKEKIDSTDTLSNVDHSNNSRKPNIEGDGYEL